ncbi:MAG: tRNA A-37 threonylcarbamoyl transferase component Bud32/tetratricopeptide (TPR) repeat protein [Hyphomicrobiaceae bacterium]
MSEPFDPDLERLVATALDHADEGIEISLRDLCRERPDLLQAVAAALNRSHELNNLHQAAQAHDPLRDRVLANRYRLQEPLGAGAMGIVYQALDLELQRPVAVKILRADLLDGKEAELRFVREAEVLAAIQHPTIVTVFDRGSSDDGLLFLVMELLDGLPLSTLLAEARDRSDRDRNAIDSTSWLRNHFDENTQLDASLVRQSIRWIAKLAEGLQAAHAAGVYHRDIKPSNIMLRRDGEPVLLDFGIASRSAEVTVAERITPIGTPAYLDPASLLGNKTNEAVDVYGLTSTLYHMVTMRPPYQGTPTEVLAELQRRDPPTAAKLRPGLPRDLQAVLDCGMNRRLSQRYKTVGALSQDLQALLTFRPTLARPIGSVRRAARHLIRSREMRTAAAVIATLLIVTSLVAWRINITEDARQQWLALWAKMPPAQFDAPVRMRPIADVPARDAVAARLEQLVELGVEPVPSLLCRGAFRYDYGDRIGAAQDFQALADIIGSPYARDLAASYQAASHQAAQTSNELQLPKQPPQQNVLDIYLFVFHQLRQGPPLLPSDMELLDAYANLPPFARDLQLRCRQVSAFSIAKSEWPKHFARLYELVLRIEADYGHRTALTATVLGMLYLEQDRTQNAIDTLRDGRDLAPEAHSLRINMGNSLRISGDTSAAREQFEIALRLRPRSFGVRRTLLMTLLDIEDYEAAEQLIEKTTPTLDLATPGEQSEMHGRMALARAEQHQMLGNDEQRITYAQHALQALEAGTEAGNYRCKHLLPIAREYAGEFPDLTLEQLRRGTETPTDWRMIGEIVRCLPEQLTKEQTAALRQYLLKLRTTVAPHLTGR